LFFIDGIGKQYEKEKISDSQSIIKRLLKIFKIYLEGMKKNLFLQRFSGGQIR